MSLPLQNPLPNSIYRIKLYFPTKTTTHFNPTLQKSFISHNPFNNGCSPLQRNLYLPRNTRGPIKATDYTTFDIEEQERPNKLINFDALLSVLESLCVVSSVIVSVGCAVNWVLFRQQNCGLVVLANRVLVWLLAGAVAVGSVIRRRQWKRVCGPVTVKSKEGMENGNVIERIEKLEESMKSVTTIIRMLSRQLEKLGVRFRVTRKALRDPISEIAALAQKNSEATRALAVQEDLLEKELAEVQKVLLVMQDQQQKQLDLILAIAKSAKLVDSKQAPPPPRPAVHEKGSTDGGLRQVDGQQFPAMAGQKVAMNDES